LLEPESGLLFRGDKPLGLTPKTFSALVYLAERRGRLVTKDELMRALWSDAVVSESNLTQTIFTLRKALAEGNGGRRYIATVPGRGYRFEAEVLQVSDNGYGAIAAETPEVATDIARQLAKPTPQGRRRLVAAVAITLIAMGACGGLFAWWRAQHRRPAVAGRIMLAVLPFQNLTGEAGQDYFSDGLTEEMISRLGRLDPAHLGVIARTSVMHYRNQQIPLDQVGRELGVKYVLEGSVRRDADHVRVTAQLLQTSDQTHVWSREYDRDVRGLLAIQSEIAHEVADEIQLTLGRENLPKPEGMAGASRHGYESYDSYLEGLYFLNKRIAPDLRQAIASFRQAVEKDPRNARAWAGLAECYALMGGYTGSGQVEFIPEARAAALKSLEIDDGLAEAHTALALILQNYDWDWQTSEREFRRAIQLNPSDATAHQWYAEHLMWRGRFDDALRESEEARRLDPLSLIVASDNGAIYYFSRQYDQAIEKWRWVLQMEPQFPRAHLIVAAYVEKGMFSEANRLVPVCPTEPWCLAQAAYIYGRSGNKAQAVYSIRELTRLNHHEPVDPILFAWAWAGVKDKKQMLFWLERAYAQRSIEIVSLKVCPVWDPLRDEPRFTELVQMVGLSG
jgi:TolB-like protein/DNA-binding winged helix-turn-helix (wHTH) protein/Tfp pilus assembly protein PilF